MSHQIIVVLFNSLGKLLVLDSQTFSLHASSCSEVLRRVLRCDCADLLLAAHEATRHGLTRQ